MHVCFFANKSKKANDGATLSLINIAKEMADRNINVTIIIPDKSLRYPLKHKNIKMINIPAFSMRTKLEDYSITNKVKEFIKINYNRCVISRTLKVIKKIKPDIIHINGIDAEVGAAVAKKLEIPYVWHIRQLLEEDLGRRLHNKKKMYRLLSMSNGIIAISKVVQMKFEKKLNRSIDLIYNGIPLDNYIIKNKKQIFLNKTIKVLLAGRVVKQKGQLEAVKAINYLIAKDINNIELTIVGNMQDLCYVNKIKAFIKQNNLNQNINLLEHVSNLKNLRREHDIALVCSIKEAFGRVTIESMASRMLVIGANTGGTLEIIDEYENGLLYEQGNYVSLAKKIEYAINNKEKMKRLAENGYRTTIKKYSIKNVVDRIMELYSTLL